MRIQPLTKKQKAVYDVVATTIRTRGYAPSLSEICEALGLRSLATVHKHLEALREKGHISREWNRQRSTVLTVQDGHCVTCGQRLPQESESSS